MNAHTAHEHCTHSAKFDAACDDHWYSMNSVDEALAKSSTIGQLVTNAMRPRTDKSWGSGVLFEALGIDPEMPVDRLRALVAEHDTTESVVPWEREAGVLCVVCPGCAFTFDAFHTDDGPTGGYTCPVCNQHGDVRAGRDTPTPAPPEGTGGTAAVEQAYGNYGTGPYQGPPFVSLDTADESFFRYFQRDRSKPDTFGVVAHKNTDVLRQPDGADPVDLWECRVVPVRRAVPVQEPTQASGMPEGGGESIAPRSPAVLRDGGVVGGEHEPHVGRVDVRHSGQVVEGSPGEPLRRGDGVDHHPLDLDAVLDVEGPVEHRRSGSASTPALVEQANDLVSDVVGVVDVGADVVGDGDGQEQVSFSHAGLVRRIDGGRPEKSQETRGVPVQEPTCTTCGDTKVIHKRFDGYFDTPVPCPVCAVLNPESSPQ